MIFLKYTALAVFLTAALLASLFVRAEAEPVSGYLLTLDEVILLAIRNDPWQQKSAFQEHAALARSVALSSMPDPVVSIGIANLPSDGFAFNQEPMTQLKAGISQMFPRGDTLKFQRQQQLELSQQQPFMRQDRQAKIAVTAAHLWLDAFRANASIRLIENDRALFEQLGEIAQSSYASGLGSSRQQDLLQAELELVRIEDRLLLLSAQQAQAMEKLSEWTATDNIQDSDANAGELPNQTFSSSQRANLPEVLPNVDAGSFFARLGQHTEFKVNANHLTLEKLSTLVQNANQQHLAEQLAMHPMIQSIERKIAAGQTGIQLAKQKYKPQWGVSASYAYRDDDPLGRSRADFLSIGLSFDLPLFTENRQDQELSSAVNEAQAIKTEKRLAIRNLMASLRAVYANYQRLLARQQLYEQRFLIQTQQQAEATLSAYTNDEGEFAEVVRARIAVLNTQLDALNIEVDLLKAKVQMAYFFVQADANPVAHLSRSTLQPLSSFQLSSGVQ